ncbi:MAG: prephenate dehydratase [Betaproteobacteria bacterium]|nr:prephenate dehydratase [Betaproteobacteria bacterium]
MADPKPEISLQLLREKIDQIDLEILRLLNARARAAGEIGTLKTGVLYRPEREAQVLRRARELNPGPLGNDTVAFLFREIMSACLAFERPITVACLGPSGTYSEAAAVRQFGHAATTLSCATLDDVFRVTETGKADFAVVPVENSTEGAVGHALDLMIETPLKVCGEIQLRIRHQLLAEPGVTELKDIARVFSHSQSLGQCQHWLNAYLPQAERLAVSSNAEAARLAAQQPGSAAIAGELAGERYGLSVLYANIEDEATNTTRFLVLGPELPGPSGHDKTSLVLAARNRPGAIHELLTPLAACGVSMTRLESRPSRTALWEYVFFVDVEGHQQDSAVATAIRALEEKALFCKVLGSYPVAAL